MNKGVQHDFFQALMDAPNYLEFEKIWAFIKDQISTDELTKLITTGPHKGKSILWLLAKEHAKGNSGTFRAAIFHHLDKISLNAITSAPEQGEDKGKSILWFVAQVAEQGRFVPLFEQIWKAYQDQLTLSALLAQAEEGEYKETTVIHFLACLGLPAIGKSKFLVFIIDKFINALQKDLLQKRQHKNASIVMLAGLAARHNPDTFLAVWKKFKNDVTLEATFELMEDPNEGFQLAKVLDEAGYFNAYYDLSNHFKLKQQPDQVYAALEKLSEDSPHYKATRKEVAEYHLKIGNIESSLQHALNIEDGLGRTTILQAIACLYVYGKQEGPQNLIPEYLLDVMNDTNEVKWCLTCFADIKKDVKIEWENNNLREQLKEKTQSVQALQQDLKNLNLSSSPRPNKGFL